MTAAALLCSPPVLAGCIAGDLPNLTARPQGAVTLGTLGKGCDAVCPGDR